MGMIHRNELGVFPSRDKNASFIICANLMRTDNIRKAKPGLSHMIGHLTELAL